jgi:hypothetical protein
MESLNGEEEGETHELYNNLMECTPGSMSCHVVFTEREGAWSREAASSGQPNPSGLGFVYETRSTKPCRQAGRWSLATNPSGEGRKDE